MKSTFLRVTPPCLAACVIVLSGMGAFAETPYGGSADFTKYAMKLRESAILRMEPQVVIPTARTLSVSTKYPWKTGIVTTVFWIGEPAGGNAGRFRSGAPPQNHKLFPEMLPVINHAETLLLELRQA